jgi:hypothetical protein
LVHARISHIQGRTFVASHSLPFQTTAQQPIQSPFSQSWIQALTSVAENPVARTIKPRMDLVNALVLARTETDRLDVARQLWDLAEQSGLTELLRVVPTARPQWVFDSDDVFLYRTVASSLPPTSAVKPTAGSFNFEAWQQAIGLLPTEVPLTAEIFNGDWASLVRKEALRLQQSFSMSAIGSSNTLTLPCRAGWDLKSWSVRFDSIDWVVVRYEEIPSMSRPSYEELEELFAWLIATSGEATVPKKNSQCDFRPQLPAWTDCVPALSGLHRLLSKSPNDFSPWMVRVWHCVWPIVYREQQVLRERADIAVVRNELRICLTAQPQLCLWMFLFAKLVCQTQVGTGLGFCADFRD